MQRIAFRGIRMGGIGMRPALRVAPRLATSLRQAGSRLRVPQQSVRVRGKATEAAVDVELLKQARNSRLVSYWVYGTAAAVAAMIVLGGVTRLTRSGLSMVEWRPEGSKLPSTDEEWEAAFEKYKQFPEYAKVNQGMTLEEFKGIYFMEWFHRMWGRGMGALFLLPAAAFGAAGMIPAIARTPLLIAGLLGATQGGVGWWMVKSGLSQSEEDVKRNKEPRVSAYRLTAHLAMAFSIYSVLMWTGMNLSSHAAELTAAAAGKTVASTAAAASSASGASLAAIRRLRPVAAVLLPLVGATALAGAFVAGNDAGRAYNDWPLYAGDVVPKEIWDDELGMRNFFENTATVQFDHRNLAYLTVATVGALALRARAADVAPHLPASVSKAVTGVVHTTGLQFGLGIATLMSIVPVSLGTMHQAGAILLWTAALALRHKLGTAAATEAQAVARVSGAGAGQAAKEGASKAAAFLLPVAVTGGLNEHRSDSLGEVARTATSLVPSWQAGPCQHAAGAQSAAGALAAQTRLAQWQAARRAHDL